MSPTDNNAIDYNEARNGAVTPEKGPGSKDDWDSSSGKVEALEEAPGADSDVVDKMTERAILRKLDYRIVPMVMWVYLMNMMDRGMFTFLCQSPWLDRTLRLIHSFLPVNIGNARLFGLEEDLNMSGSDFQLAVSLLFVTYCVSTPRKPTSTDRAMR